MAKGIPAKTRCQCVRSLQAAGVRDASQDRNPRRILREVPRRPTPRLRSGQVVARERHPSSDVWLWVIPRTCGKKGVRETEAKSLPVGRFESWKVGMLEARKAPDGLSRVGMAGWRLAYTGKKCAAFFCNAGRASPHPRLACTLMASSPSLALLIVLSANSVRSAWVKKELEGRGQSRVEGATARGIALANSGRVCYSTSCKIIYRETGP